MSKFCLTIIAKKKITSFSMNFCTKIIKKKKVRLFERFWNSMKDDKILQFWVWMEVWSFDPRDPSIWCPWRKCDVWWPLRLHAPLRIPIASIHFSAWTTKKEKYVKIPKISTESFSRLFFYPFENGDSLFGQPDWIEDIVM